MSFTTKEKKNTFQTIENVADDALIIEITFLKEKEHLGNFTKKCMYTMLTHLMQMVIHASAF